MAASTYSEYNREEGRCLFSLSHSPQTFIFRTNINVFSLSHMLINFKFSINNILFFGRISLVILR